MIPSHSEIWDGYQLLLSTTGSNPAAIRVSLTNFEFLFASSNPIVMQIPSSIYTTISNPCNLQYFTRGLRSFVNTNGLGLSPNGSTVNTKYFPTLSTDNANLDQFGVEGIYRRDGNLTSDRN